MKNKHLILLLISIGLTTIDSGCTKTLLDAKPSTDILQPVTLNEFQRLLENVPVINSSSPGLGILAADEYIYSSSETWQSARTATERNSYKWAKDLYEGEVSEHWNMPYGAIFYANNVLAGLEKMEITLLNRSQWNVTKGWALFVRAFAYYDLINNFAATYDASSAGIDPGVPLRLKPSIDELLPRASVQETYTQIFNDLGMASQLLEPVLPTANRNRPSKIAAHALFARIYLNISAYHQAELHADSCLQLYNKLIDYNTINQTAALPFSLRNDEMIYAKSAVSIPSYSATGNNTYTQIANELINLYQTNDLRLPIFFTKQNDGSYDLKRGYYGGGGNAPFTGLATDEVYLIKAECAARRSDPVIAMDYLNALLIKRYATNKFTPAIATTGNEALSKILIERKKELVWRGLAWDDLKRLNKEGANITITRAINNETYSLPPNDPKYIFPIPDNEINLSNIQQNKR